MSEIVQKLPQIIKTGNEIQKTKDEGKTKFAMKMLIQRL